MKTSIQKKEQNTTLNASKKQTRPPMNTVGLESDDRASIREIISKQALQAKLKIGAPNDKYEQEADRVAEKVIHAPEPVLQKQLLEEEEEKGLLQTKPIIRQITPLVQRQSIMENGDQSLNRVLSNSVNARMIQRKINYDDCDRKGGSDEEDAIKAAHKIAVELLGLVIEQFSTNPNVVLHKFRAAFTSEYLNIPYDHSKEQEMIDKVLQAYREALAGLSAEDFNYECDYKEDWNLKCDENALAWTMKTGMNDIHLCWKFFDSSPIDQAHTIIHEALHKYAGISHESDPLNDADKYGLFFVYLRKGGLLAPLPLEEREERRIIQPKKDSGKTPELKTGIESDLSYTGGRGQPLADSVRAYFEPRFGIDFSKVRIHTDSNVVQINKALGAKAFTHGPDIYFNAGMYDTNSNDGKRLIAHELTHVVQQTGGQVQRQENPKGQIARAPEKTIQRAIKDVQQAELSTFFSQPEPLLPQPLQDKYLVDPALMATQRSVIRALVDRVQGSEAPLTANQLQTLVLSQESDLGTALIICHNVTKALSRGKSPINWSNVSRDPDPLVYSLNGTIYTFDPDSFYPDAEEFARNQESVFYAMLSPDQFGQRDDGDWYHYYAMATASYYRASGNLQTDNPSQLDPFTQFTGELVRRLADALRDSSVTNSPAYEGWLMANAMSFLEGGHYGQSQDEVNAETNIHIQGASGGLATVGRIPEEIWQWYVPRAGSISIGDLSNFQFRGDMIANIRAGIDGYFELTIISGTTPDHWYDTPDSFVKLPGLFSSRTTTKDNTSTPVWNETLTILHHDRLASVTLQLYDADPLVNDHISDFTDDLRPQGQRSRNFSLTSGSSTLEVRVEATGNVVLATP